MPVIGAAPFRRPRGRGEIGRRAWFRSKWETVGVRVPPPAPPRIDPSPQNSGKAQVSIKTVETQNEGLKRAFMLTIPAEDIEARVDKEVKRSEEHTSELQSPVHLVCRLLLEKKKI